MKLNVLYWPEIDYIALATWNGVINFDPKIYKKYGMNLLDMDFYIIGEFD